MIHGIEILFVFMKGTEFEAVRDEKFFFLSYDTMICRKIIFTF